MRLFRRCRTARGPRASIQDRSQQRAWARLGKARLLVAPAQGGCRTKRLCLSPRSRRDWRGAPRLVGARACAHVRAAVTTPATRPSRALSRSAPSGSSAWKRPRGPPRSAQRASSTAAARRPSCETPRPRIGARQAAQVTSLPCTQDALHTMTMRQAPHRARPRHAPRSHERPGGHLLTRVWSSHQAPHQLGYPPKTPILAIQVAGAAPAARRS